MRSGVGQSCRSHVSRREIICLALLQFIYIGCHRVKCQPMVIFCALFCTLTFGVSPAYALKTRLRIFESASFSQPSAFENPTGITVDQETGNIYIADSAADTVYIFGAEGGSPVDVPTQITGLELSTDEPEAVAVDNACYYHNPRLAGKVCEELDPSNGDVYVAESAMDAIAKYKLNSLSGNYELIESLNILGEPNGVAVDTDGNVYIASYGNKAISEFNPTGAKLGEIKQTFIEHPAYVAVGDPGVLYVGNYEGGVAKLEVTSKDEVVHEVELDSMGYAVALDSQGDVYVDDGTSISEYSSSGTLDEEFGSGYFEKSQGVAVNDLNGTTYVSDSSGANIDAFGPAVVVPDVTTEAASNVKQMSVKLNGMVNPDDINVSNCQFEYGTSTTYTQSIPCVPSPGAGAGDVQVYAEPTGLQSGTTYYFRLAASNVNGTNHGQGETFTTKPPLIESEWSTNVASTSATLFARVNPLGVSTKYSFEYDTNEYSSAGSHGVSLPVVDANIISSGPSQIVSVHVQNLQADTTYHYRVVASNELVSPLALIVFSQRRSRAVNQRCSTNGLGNWCPPPISMVGLSSPSTLNWE